MMEFTKEQIQTYNFIENILEISVSSYLRTSLCMKIGKAMIANDPEVLKAIHFSFVDWEVKFDKLVSMDGVDGIDLPDYIIKAEQTFRDDYIKSVIGDEEESDIKPEDVTVPAINMVFAYKFHDKYEFYTTKEFVKHVRRHPDLFL